MVYLTKIPDHAVLFDAVEIAKVKGHAGIASYVNGVLRNVQRNGLRDWKTISNAKKRISVGTSMPKWLVAYFIERIDRYRGNRKDGVLLIGGSVCLTQVAVK